MIYQPTCGERINHDSHNFIDAHFKEHYCEGVCAWCFLRGRVHSSGDHK